MATVKHHKVVAALPAELEPDALYLVRRGEGFDLYVTNHSGVIVPYPLNAPSAAASFFGLVTVIASATGQTEFAIPGGYTPGAVVVFLNGASLAPVHYTASDGATVVLASGAGVVPGTELVVLRLSAFEVADALPLMGTAQNSLRYGGVLPPPEDGKQYALKDGAWVEVAAGGAAAWGGITGIIADQADLSAALEEKVDDSEVDFTIIYPNGGSEASPATIAGNSRYVESNPFPGFMVMATVEIFAGGEWFDPGVMQLSGTTSYGAKASQLNDGEIVVRTNPSGLMNNPAHSGAASTVSTLVSSAPCRVKVWKVKGAIA